MHKLKILGLALVIVGALSALAASSASAAYTIVPSEGFSGSVVASQATQNKLGTDVGNVICSVAKFAGLQNSTEMTLTVHPTYSGCTLAGLAATISTTSCSYRFGLPATLPLPLHTGVQILCSAGTSIIIHESLGLNCSVSVGAQGPLNTISFANSTPSVTFTAAVTGIKYTDNGKCPSTGVEATSSSGSYTGSWTASGFSIAGTAAKEFRVT